MDSQQPGRAADALDAEIHQWLVQALAGRGRMLFLTGRGEALSHAIDRVEIAARQMGWSVARIVPGACDQPFAGWRKLLAGLRGAALSKNRSRRLRRLAARLAAAGPDAMPEFGELDGVASMLIEAAVRSPLAIVWLNLERADVASLRMLTFVARAVHRSRVLIVASVAEPVPAASAALLTGELARESRRLSVDSSDEPVRGGMGSAGRDAVGLATVA